MSGPLAGIRIVDLTTMISGPFATMLLGDQGADVVKIERPDGGDQMRRFGRRSGALTAPFVNNNRGKRSVAVDLKRPEGAEVVKRIASTADVFVQNFRPGVVARLGLAEEVLRDLNPRLVYVSISGFGGKGPLAHKPAYDPIFQAASGLASIQGASDSARPRMVRAMLPDKIAALNAAQAVSTALYAREKTGLGQHVELSMLDAVLSFLWSGEMDGHTFLEHQAEGPEESSPFDLIYETGDGYICVATVTSAQWVGFANATGNSHWLQDPRFATSEAREAHRTERLELMQEVLRTRPTDEWNRAAGAGGRALQQNPHPPGDRPPSASRRERIAGGVPASRRGRDPAGARPREVRPDPDVPRPHAADARRAYRRGAVRSGLLRAGDRGAQGGRGRRLIDARHAGRGAGPAPAPLPRDGKASRPRPARPPLPGRGPVAAGGQNLSHQGRTSSSSVQAERSWQCSA